MSYKEIDYGHYKAEIKALLRKRLDLKDRVLYHKRKQQHHEDRIKEIQENKLTAIDKELERYMKQVKEQ